MLKHGRGGTGHIVTGDTPMIHLNQGVRQPTTAPTKRTPIKTYHPANAPHITAAVTYQDPNLGIVAHSIRSNLGIMAASTSIHWDVGVFNQLVADGCTWLECYVKTLGHTYRAHINTMIEHGQQQQRFGWQYVLHLRYWSVDGQPPELDKQPSQPPVAPSAQQIGLFDAVDRLGAAQ